MATGNLLEKMKLARDSEHVAYTKFVNIYSKKNTDILYCFFEGDEDKKYYGTRLIVGYKREFKDFTCNGKDKVLKIQVMIKNRSEYNHAKTLFFVDKDYSDDSTKDNIYVTPCYSIENFYSTIETLKLILQHELSISEDDENFINILTYYNKSLILFHNKLIFLNTWLSCQDEIRRKSKSTTRLNINETLKKYFKENENMFTENLQIKLDIFNNLENQTFLEDTLFPNAPKVTDNMINNKKAYFSSVNKSCMFRGKFEFKFFIDFLKRMKEDLTKKELVIFKTKYKCNLIFQVDNAISVLSQYANTPNCLNTFFDENLKNIPSQN